MERDTRQQSAGSAKPGTVTWMSLPRKDQLFILFLGRLVDFLQMASMQAYVFYQLKAIDNSLSDAAISRQAGVLQACFTGAQILTAMMWGKAADTEWFGRKWVIIIGLAGTAVSCVGYGFATTFFWAAFWRMFGGAVNGTVSVIRTMISEIIKEKRYQSRAFLILPMSFNLAGILGPFLGGILADPEKTLPSLFAPGSIFSFRWVHSFPFALPSLVSALALAAVSAIAFLFLEETSRLRKDKYDAGLAIGQRIKKVVMGTKPNAGYAQVPTEEAVPMLSLTPPTSTTPRKPITRQLPFSRIWTRNVIFTLIAIAFFDFNLGAFTNIWSLFLSTPRHVKSEPQKPQRRDLPFLFTGGLGMPASTVGMATSILGVIGMILQLTLYPPIQARLGTLRSFRWFLPLFAICYFIAPTLAILPSSSKPPEAASGPIVWLGITFVLFLQVTARTFTMPASIILLNNCSPHPSVLGTIHGLGQSVSAMFRTVGPIVGGWWYGYGLDIGMVAWGWWGVAIVTALGGAAALGMHEGSGHEIILEGEDEGL